MWNRSKDRARQSGFSFPDLPPDKILLQHFGKIARVDRNELERAEWFWKKRPMANFMLSLTAFVKQRRLAPVHIPFFLCVRRFDASSTFLVPSRTPAAET
jgi:hypothetical protein